MIEFTKDETMEILEQLGKLPCSDVWQLVQHVATKLATADQDESLIDLE